jgi:hypothetical protein
MLNKKINFNLEFFLKNKTPRMSFFTELLALIFIS